jgi:large subunit ribosomal protein L29
MKAQHYREMRPDELEGSLEELERHLFDLRSQAVTEKLENSKAIINVRRDIARIKTILHERSNKITAENVEVSEKKVKKP